MEIREFGCGYLASVGNICAFGMTVAEAEFRLIISGVIPCPLT
jgi:hypothetical protein